MHSLLRNVNIKQFSNKHNLYPLLTLRGLKQYIFFPSCFLINVQYIIIDYRIFHCNIAFLLHKLHFCVAKLFLQYKLNIWNELIPVLMNCIRVSYSWCRCWTLKAFSSNARDTYSGFQSVYVSVYVCSVHWDMTDFSYFWREDGGRLIAPAPLKAILIVKRRARKPAGICGSLWESKPL